MEGPVQTQEESQLHPSHEYNRLRSISSDLVSLSSSDSEEVRDCSPDDVHPIQGGTVDESIESSTVVQSFVDTVVQRLSGDGDCYGRITDVSDVVDDRQHSQVHTVSQSSSTNASIATSSLVSSTTSKKSQSCQMYKTKLTVSDYESAGLLYARTSDVKLNL